MQASLILYIHDTGNNSCCYVCSIDFLCYLCVWFECERATVPYSYLCQRLAFLTDLSELNFGDSHMLRNKRFECNHAIVPWVYRAVSELCSHSNISNKFLEEFELVTNELCLLLLRLGKGSYIYVLRSRSDIKCVYVFVLIIIVWLSCVQIAACIDS